MLIQCTGREDNKQSNKFILKCSAMIIIKKTKQDKIIVISYDNIGSVYLRRKKLNSVSLRMTPNVRFEEVIQLTRTQIYRPIK
jgi:hypothetical protein